jgi:aminoglycoside phosphotransferase
MARTTVVNEATRSSSCSNPINDTRLNRFLVLAGVKLLRRFRTCWGSVLFLTPQLCVKIGERTDLSEAATMEFVRKHTSIPVPKVYCAFRRRGKTYIVMENISGMPAAASWERLTEKSKNRLLGQLREMIDEMRRIPAPNSRISNVDGGSLFDCRLRSSLDRFGPFENTQTFHGFLRNWIEKGPPEHLDVDEMISLHRREWGRPVFTHGDLSSLNILVRGDDIVGFVDWETAGWYPPYWEYTSACQVNPRNTFWAGYIGRFLEPWPEALKMEKTRQQWWGVI